MLCKTIKWHYLWPVTPSARPSVPPPTPFDSPCQIPNGALVYVIAVPELCLKGLFMNPTNGPSQRLSFDACMCVCVCGRAPP